MVWPIHNRLVVRGTLGTGKEIFSNSLHFTSVASLGTDTHPGDWDEGDVSDAVAAFYGSLNFGSSAKVTDWRGYTIGTNGRLQGNQMVRHDYATPVPGAGGFKYPPQIAQVLSLHAADRGPAQRGRIYLPMPTVTVTGTTFEMASVDAQALLADFKTYIEALKNAMYPTLTINENLVNVSQGGSGGTMQVVSEYRMGRVLDTVRSRRNKLLEEYEVLSA
jgi:hypothetical protein